MEMVGSGLNSKNNLRKKKNEEYFDAVEVVYLAMSEVELNGRLSRVVRTLLEIDETLVSRDLALLGQNHAIEPEAA